MRLFRFISLLACHVFLPLLVIICLPLLVPVLAVNRFLGSVCHFLADLWHEAR